MENDWKLDWLKTVLRGTFVVQEHFGRVRSILLRAFDEQDMRDKLDVLKAHEPDIFDTSEQDHRSDMNDVLRGSAVLPNSFAVLKSFLRHCSSRASMLVTVETLRKSHSEWFRRQR